MIGPTARRIGILIGAAGLALAMVLTLPGAAPWVKAGVVAFALLDRVIAAPDAGHGPRLPDRWRSRTGRRPPAQHGGGIAGKT
ncbi:MAG: hypothetical protein AAGE76_12575 [Pseudomonadota bacterium]